MSPVWDIFLINFFSLSVAFLFTFLIVQETKSLNFNVAQFINCFLYGQCFLNRDF